MATKKFRGQSATLEISGNNLASEAVAVIDEPEVAAPEQTVQTLRGAGSTKIQDRQKTETEVSVSGEISAFALDTWDRLIDYDEAAGQLDNSPEVPLFDVTVVYTAADGSTKEIVVKDCHVDGSIPLGGSREEWIGMSLELVGSDLSITNTDAASA